MLNLLFLILIYAPSSWFTLAREYYDIKKSGQGIYCHEVLYILAKNQAQLLVNFRITFVSQMRC